MMFAEEIAGTTAWKRSECYSPLSVGFRLGLLNWLFGFTRKAYQAHNSSDENLHCVELVLSG